ncbi:hypothetical protein BJ742DRAFT_293259 [Cladochytrium replicatum]|nr:hypothetical protein BJ742DRAFT_293259 [Cladochytrium replicatum]
MTVCEFLTRNIPSHMWNTGASAHSCLFVTLFRHVVFFSLSIFASSHAHHPHHQSHHVNSQLCLKLCKNHCGYRKLPIHPIISVWFASLAFISYFYSLVFCITIDFLLHRRPSFTPSSIEFLEDVTELRGLTMNFRRIHNGGASGRGRRCTLVE